jgi:hypothetical protein
MVVLMVLPYPVMRIWIDDNNLQFAKTDNQWILKD